MSDPNKTSDAIYSDLLDDDDSDEELLELIDGFVADLPQRVAAFRAALAGSDLEAVARLAHQLKGAAGGYGFQSITAVASCLEAAANARDVEKSTANVEEIANLCARAHSTPART